MKHNKTVLITGSSLGFGKDASKKFAAEGWNVIATMREPEKEEELTLLDNILVVKLDVQDLESITTAIRLGIKRFGKIDVLVNNAGYGTIGTFEQATREQVRRQFDVNVFGLMDVTRVMLPHFRENEGGTIINISSMGGRVTFPLLSLYHASKFAIEGFSESLSYELKPLNIQVKLVEPGSSKTNFANTSAQLIPNALPAYEKISNEFWTRYPKPTAHFNKCTPIEVAEVIYEAASDGKDQLRYLIGPDAEMYTNIKLNNPDQEYVNQMRDYFIS